MAEKIENKIGHALRRYAAVQGGMIVNRPPRRSITGIEFTNQVSRLLLDEPDATGNDVYPCQIANVSDAGFGVVCSAARSIPHPFHAGGLLTLHDTEGERVRVEIRWIKNDRLGLRRLSAKPAQMP